MNSAFFLIFLGLKVSLYIIYIVDVAYGYKHKSWNFMNSNCCLQKHWGKKSWKFIFSVFCDGAIMMWHFWDCFEVFFLPSIWAYSIKVSSPLHILVKIVVPHSQICLFFLSFFYFLYLWKIADVSIFPFSDQFFHFSTLHYVSLS